VKGVQISKIFGCRVASSHIRNVYVLTYCERGKTLSRDFWGHTRFQLPEYGDVVLRKQFLCPYVCTRWPSLARELLDHLYLHSTFKTSSVIYPVIYEIVNMDIQVPQIVALQTDPETQISKTAPTNLSLGYTFTFFFRLCAACQCLKHFIVLSTSFEVMLPFVCSFIVDGLTF
jgi:hypothetical protein